MLDLWLSDVVPGPPDGAPQVVAVTGRMITLTWNPPRSLDMAIGGSGPRRAVGRDGGVDGAGSVRGAKGAKKGGQGPEKHVGSDGSERSAGAWPGAALPASSPWKVKPLLQVRRGDKGATTFLSPPLRGIGCLCHDPGNMLPFPVHDLFLLYASVSPPQIVAGNWDKVKFPPCL